MLKKETYNKINNIIKESNIVNINIDTFILSLVIDSVLKNKQKLIEVNDNSIRRDTL